MLSRTLATSARTQLVLTLIAGAIVVGGLVRLAVDDRRVAVQFELDEPNATR